MTAFAVQLEALQEVLDQLGAFDRLAVEAMDVVDAGAARLRQAWYGAAAQEYAATHATWARDAHDLDAALAELRRIVATAHGNYSAAVTANRAMWP